MNSKWSQIFFYFRGGGPLQCLFLSGPIFSFWGEIYKGGGGGWRGELNVPAQATGKLETVELKKNNRSSKNLRTGFVTTTEKVP